ncbi:MAG: membrane protein insertase YidC [Microbacteriaceae bacterium]|jgi:YidC/Oxa1 family membrane protein insertase|nr:membrane protein insertase YidC [Microbacteriaceae bacterium]
MMPDILGIILWPFRWAIEALLIGFHWVLTQVGMDPSDGWTWVLSITGLVLVVRAALIPLFVRQIKSQRKMLEVAPDLKRIQDKYKGKRDQFSREAMTRETMALYGKHGTSPFASCLPLLFQMPVFFGLFTTLNNAALGIPGIGFMNLGLAENFGAATIFGTAPLHAAMSTAEGDWTVIWTAGVMVVLMTASQFITQKQIMSKNISQAMKESPTYKQQQILLYILPLVFLFSGFAFPLGVMMYWLVSNFWTMGQQFVVIRNMPTPGSEAFHAWEARQEKKNIRKGIVIEAEPIEEVKPAQRQQPMGKNRAKRGKGKK